MPNYATYDLPDESEDERREFASAVISRWRSAVRKRKFDRKWDNEQEERVRRYQTNVGLSYIQAYYAVYKK